MMDSGSSISFIMKSFVKNNNYSQLPLGLKLISAAGEAIPGIGQVVTPIRIGNLLVDHNYIFVDSLITPVIVDLTTTPVTIHNPSDLHPRSTFKNVCAVSSRRVAI